MFINAIIVGSGIVLGGGITAVILIIILGLSIRITFK
jgi:hypothetical protein